MDELRADVLRDFEENDGPSQQQEVQPMQPNPRPDLPPRVSQTPAVGAATTSAPRPLPLQQQPLQQQPAQQQEAAEGR